MPCLASAPSSQRRLDRLRRRKLRSTADDPARDTRSLCGADHELLWFTRWSDVEGARAFAAAYDEVADSIARVAPLASRPRVVVDGRTALVLTDRLADLAPLLLERSEVRAYRRLNEWIADDCFTESPCPWVEGALPERH